MCGAAKETFRLCVFSDGCFIGYSPRDWVTDTEFLVRDAAGNVICTRDSDEAAVWPSDTAALDSPRPVHLKDYARAAVQVEPDSGGWADWRERRMTDRLAVIRAAATSELIDSGCTADEAAREVDDYFAMTGGVIA